MPNGKLVGNQIDGVNIIKNVLIPMRDGVMLAADIYVPDHVSSLESTDISLPVVVEYTPYRKDEVTMEDSWFVRLPRNGYFMARVDVRGTGASGGINTDEYMVQEQLDGYDLVEWFGSQSWCDGHVNIIGLSYGGNTCLHIAAVNPPHLTSIIPIYFTDDRYTDDCHYRGGLLRMYYDVGAYGNEMIVKNALPPFPEWSDADWAQLWEERLEQNEPYILKWLEHQTNDAYWRHGSLSDCPERIQCPVFMIGGWRDGYPNPPLRFYQMLSTPKKVLIGPWNHSLPDVAIPGPRIDYLHEVLRWLDFWCKDKKTGIMDDPPITIFVQRYSEPLPERNESQGEWRAETEWPPSNPDESVLYLSADGCLLDDEPKNDGYDTFTYNPSTGVMAGLWSGGIPFGQPGDQRIDEAYSLVYSTPPLQKDVTIIGRCRALLHVSSSATVVGFCASLCDVAPDGTSHLVAKGMLNATRRHSLADPELLTPGEIYALDIEVDATAWRFIKGHRIRLDIANADFPNVWPTPEPATNHVYFGPQLSRIYLPTVPPDGNASPPEFRPSNSGVEFQLQRTHIPRWEIVHDLLRNQSKVHISSQWDFRVNDTTVIACESLIECQVPLSNPSQASARGRHISRIIQPAWTVENSSDLSILGTRTHFHITIDLVITINKSHHFNRRWVKSIPRNML